MSAAEQLAKQEKPAHQRPELPDFWDKRFSEGVTPWEAHCVPQALREFAAAHVQQATARRVLVPGCGSALEAAWLDRAGWDVTALDFSAAAVARARQTLGEAFGGRLLCADFFDFVPAAPFSLIVERAFLCALPRKLRAGYARRMAELLAPGCLLAGVFFVAEQLKGPPFGISQEELDALLGDAFTLRDDRPVHDSPPVFAGRERFQVWERKGTR